MTAMASILRISDAAALALHTMAYLAASHPTRVPNRAIASSLHASEAHLSKVLQRLVRSGFVASIRGPHGGFVLARDPGDVRLIDVYEAIEGPLDSRTCLFGDAVCHSDSCVMGDVLSELYGRVNTYLTTTTLSDLAVSFDTHDARGGD